jgi:hypothetical protein
MIIKSAGHIARFALNLISLSLTARSVPQSLLTVQTNSRALSERERAPSVAMSGHPKCSCLFSPLLQLRLAIVLLSPLIGVASLGVQSNAADGTQLGFVLRQGSSGSCEAGATYCDYCPGSGLLDCCEAGHTCTSGYGCVKDGYIPCSEKCQSTLRSCGCLTSAPCDNRCCNGRCCQRAIPTIEGSFGATSQPPREPGNNGGSSNTNSGSSDSSGGNSVPTDTPRPSASVPTTSGAAGSSQNGGSSNTNGGSSNNSGGNGVPTVTPRTSASVPTTSGAAGSSQTPTGSGSSDCVDALWLAGVTGGRHLVHVAPRHPRAAVLCPAVGGLPCATPGHLVAVDGNLVTYRELCGSQACESLVMEVNAAYTHRWNGEYGPSMPAIQLDGKSVKLTMYSDFCHPRIQVTAHWLLESVRMLQVYLWDKCPFLLRNADSLSTKFALTTAM